jgi:hypothetical protein
MATSAFILRNKVKTLTRKHASITNDRDWMTHIYNSLDIDAFTAIGYVRKYQFENTCVFSVQEHGQRMAPQYAASLSNLAVRQSDFQNADLGPITLEKALIDMDKNSIVSKMFVSNTLTAGKIILRYAEDRTLTASFEEFQKRVGNIVEVELIDISASVSSELESSRNSPDSSVRHECLNTDTIDGLQNSSTPSLDHALTHALEALSIARAAGTKIDVANRKLGHINEHTFGQILNSEEGIPWSQAFRFNSLNEVVEWTGRKIKATKEERSKAIRDIVRMCVAGFETYTNANDKVEWMKVHGPLNE